MKFYELFGQNPDTRWKCKYPTLQARVTVEKRYGEGGYPYFTKEIVVYEQCSESFTTHPDDYDLDKAIESGEWELLDV